jgi:putative redox protein
MITIKSNYLGELRTEATHLRSFEKIVTDAPTDNNGKGKAFSPADLVAASLSSCMMTIMGIKAQKHGIILEGLEADVTKIMADNPRRIAKIIIEFHLQSTNASPTQLSMLKEAAITCPVALSLNPAINQEVLFHF